MFKVLLIFIMLNFSGTAFSSVKEKIISRMQLIDNLTFNFIQTINSNSETGVCTIKYPKKIFCEYSNSNKKIIVSNGKSLVIKNKNSVGYYIYQLKKTPLELLLNKEYLISKIKILKSREIDKKYINFKIFENEQEINIFFDKKNLELVGWQTKDIYQNLSITFISSTKINQKIDDKIFILPINN